MGALLSVVITLGVILVSMVLHELAHGFVAYKLGDDTAKVDGRLTLNPLKHLDPILSIAMPLLLLLTGGPVFGGAKPVPVDSRKLKHGPWGMALVAIAGPLTNILLAFLGFLIGHFTEAFTLAGISTLWGQVMSSFVMINLGFGIFNLIPIPPLDGSRVLYAIAPDPVRGVFEKIEPFGMMIVLILVVAGGGLLSGVMGWGIDRLLDGFYWVVGA